MLLGVYLQLGFSRTREKYDDSRKRDRQNGSHKLECDHRKEENFHTGTKSEDYVGGFTWEKKLNAIAAEQEINPVQLSRWKTEFICNAGRAFSKETDEIEKVKQLHEMEKDELLKQIGQLSYENAWLKKKSDRH